MNNNALVKKQSYVHIPQVLNEPKKELIEIITDLDFYGASYIIAEYCGLKKPMYYYIYYFIWQHGWLPECWNIHPFIVLPYHTSEDKSKSYLVARKDQKDYLSTFGYKKVHAIGLPLIYL